MSPSIQKEDQIQSSSVFHFSQSTLPRETQHPTHHRPLALLMVLTLLTQQFGMFDAFAGSVVDTIVRSPVIRDYVYVQSAPSIDDSWIGTPTTKSTSSTVNTAGMTQVSDGSWILPPKDISVAETAYQKQIRIQQEMLAQRQKSQNSTQQGIKNEDIPAGSNQVSDGSWILPPKDPTPTTKQPIASSNTNAPTFNAAPNTNTIPNANLPTSANYTTANGTSYYAIPGNTGPQNANTTGNQAVNGNSAIGGSQSVAGNMTVSGTIATNGLVNNGTFTQSGNSVITGDTVQTGSLSVSGTGTFGALQSDTTTTKDITITGGTGTPIELLGRDGSGRVNSVVLGSGLTLSGGTLGVNVGNINISNSGTITGGAFATAGGISGGTLYSSTDIIASGAVLGDSFSGNSIMTNSGSFQNISSNTGSINNLVSQLIHATSGYFQSLYTNFIQATTASIQTLTSSGITTDSLISALGTFQNVITQDFTATGIVNLSGATLILPSGIADNGIHLGTDGKIELGGTLHQNTTIDQSGSSMSFMNGNVGIGTDNPLRRFHIKADNTGGLTAMAIENANTTNSNGSIVSFRTDTTGASGATFQEMAGFQVLHTEHDHATRNSNFSLFARNAAGFNTLTLHGNGNVGIGPIGFVPTAKLDIAGNIKITDGTQGLGKFLTSDANGLASWTSLTGGSLTGFTSGQLTFGNVNGGLSQSSNLGWDNINGRLGVGVGSPATALDVRNTAYQQFRLSNTIGNQQLWMGSVANTIGSYIGNNAYYSNSYQFMPNDTAASGLNFRQDGSTEFWNDTGISSGTLYTPTKRMVIANNGNVGIGTITPSAILDVIGTGSSATIRANSQNGAPSLRLEASSGTPYLQFQGGSFMQEFSNNLRLRTQGITGAIVFDTNGNNERMRIDASGNVGIGTATPGSKLDVKGGIRQQNLVDGSDGVFSYNSSGTLLGSVYGYGTSYYAVQAQSGVGRLDLGSFGDIRMLVGASSNIDALHIANNGNVGIGVIAPTARLSVSGSLLLANGSQGFGKFLTSDANGLSSWTSLTGGSLTGFTSGQLAFGSSVGGLTQSGGLVWDNINGRLGIGVANPNYAKVEVGSTSLGTMNFLASSISDGTYNPRIIMSHVTSTGSQYVKFDSSYTTGVGFANWSFMNGNVGIGTITPGAKLDINGNIRILGTGGNDLTFVNATGSGYGSIGGTANGVAIRDSTNTLRARFYAAGPIFNGTTAFRSTTDVNNAVFTDSGSLGIGTTTPTYKLDVNGNANLSTGVRIGSQTGSIAYFPNITGIKLDGYSSGSYIIHTGIGRTSAEMFKIRVHGYMYSNMTDVDFTLVGYAYPNLVGTVDALSGAVINYSIVDNGNDGLQKWVGIDGNGNVAVAVGATTNGTYYYTRLSVDYWSMRNNVLSSTGWYIDQNANPGFDWGDIHTLNSLISQNKGTSSIDVAPGAKLSVSGSFLLNNGTQGSGKVLTSDANGLASWISPLGALSGSFWTLGGNSGSSLQNLGTISNFALPFITNNIERMRIDASGNVGIGTASPGAKLHIENTTNANPGTRFSITDTSNGGGTTYGQQISLATSYSTLYGLSINSGSLHSLDEGIIRGKSCIVCPQGYSYTVSWCIGRSGEKSSISRSSYDFQFTLRGSSTDTDISTIRL